MLTVYGYETVGNADVNIKKFCEIMYQCSASVLDKAIVGTVTKYVALVQGSAQPENIHLNILQLG